MKIPQNTEEIYLFLDTFPQHSGAKLLNNSVTTNYLFKNIAL